MNPAHCQSDYGIRFEWGPAGAAAVAPDCDVAVVVDVLSFTTTLSVALDAGIDVLPYRSGEDTAAQYAARADAVLAVGRSVAGLGQISLSPSTIRNMSAPPERLVLPSPNGSAISYQLGAAATTVVGSCLRNVHAVADWIIAHHSPGATIAVIAAGERWPDGSLRPAIEDLWGAGAVLDALAERGWVAAFSPEAHMARDAWVSVAADASTRLDGCASGAELIGAGYPQDVAIAAEVNTSCSIPVLRDGRFIAGS